MKPIWLLIFFFSGCTSQEGVEDIEESNEWDRNGWNIIWHDEFDSFSLDINKWSHEVGGHGFGNNELQYYTNDSSNAIIKDGIHFYNYYTLPTPKGYVSPVLLDILCPKDKLPKRKGI